MLRAERYLVTGGGSGIGKAVAARLLQENAAVVIAGRSADKLAAAKAELSAVSDKVYTMVMDISDADAIPSKLTEAEAIVGGVIGGFVNTAALGGDHEFHRGYEPFDITPDEFDLLNNTNFKGAYFMMRDEINYLLSHKQKGNILNFASNAACMDVIGSYGAAKTAVIRWTRAFGKRYGEHGIIINGIAPGATVTPMIDSYAKSVDQPYPRHAIGRFIRPEEIAELAAYLLSNWGEIVCGHTVVADGGDKSATL